LWLGLGLGLRLWLRLGLGLRLRLGLGSTHGDWLRSQKHPAGGICRRKSNDVVPAD
jgi:hypothetical protein